MLLKIGQPPDRGFDAPLGLLSDCHRRIEQFLGTLVMIAREADGRAPTESERTQLAAAISYFSAAAPRHTADEEDSLFPRLRECADPATSVALELIERLQSDHRQADEDHQAVDVLVRRWLARGTLVPADATALRERLLALQRMYDAHIETEDRVLFPAAGRVLSAEQLRAIGREMAARRRASHNRGDAVRPPAAGLKAATRGPLA